MYNFTFHRPTTVRQAAGLLARNPEGKLLAGGHSLLPVMKQRLAQPSALVDLSLVEGMTGVELKGRSVVVGAMTRHADVANSQVLKDVLPGLAAVPGSIGDPQVRNRGTIGGSIANNDPNADYPAACLGLGATIITNKRRIAADDFFTGMFSTALEDGEIIVKVSFPIAKKAAYEKFKHPASGFALVGVFVSKRGSDIRVAVTGAGANGVFRVKSFEEALKKRFSPKSIEGMTIPATGMNADIHASPEYRAHLVAVLAQARAWQRRTPKARKCRCSSLGFRRGIAAATADALAPGMGARRRLCRAVHRRRRALHRRPHAQADCRRVRLAAQRHRAGGGAVPGGVGGGHVRRRLSRRPHRPAAGSWRRPADQRLRHRLHGPDLRALARAGAVWRHLRARQWRGLDHSRQRHGDARFSRTHRHGERGGGVGNERRPVGGDRGAGGGAGDRELAFGLSVARHRAPGAGPAADLRLPNTSRAQAKAARPADGIGIREAAGTRQFWLLVGVYAICGFGDFFVGTHVVAFAQDRGISPFLAGNLLAVMGLTGLLGVVLAGALSDRSGPVLPAVLCFVARVAVFGLVLVDQSEVSVTIFALVFGLTFLMTAPLCVIFVVQSFGSRHLGALTGLITMIHHMCGGVGAYLGAASFDNTGKYDAAFIVMLAFSLVAALMALMLRKPRAAAV